MYKILHLATGTYVMGLTGEDFSFKNKEDIIKQVFNNRYAIFVKTKGHNNHNVEIGSVLSNSFHDMPNGIPKHEFEIIEV